MIASDELFRNRSNILYYDIDKIYYGIVDGNDSLIYENIINHKSRYIQLLILPDYILVDRILGNNFKIIKSLKEELESKNINLCMLHKNGEEKTKLTCEEIIKLTQLIAQLSNKSYDELNDTCTFITNSVVQLLEINTINNQNNLNSDDKVVVPAIRLDRFKETLFNYIKISLILDGEIVLDNNDYRIERALKRAKIRKPVINNFNISCIDYKIIINGEVVNSHYEKTFKNKKSLTNIK